MSDTQTHRQNHEKRPQMFRKRKFATKWYILRQSVNRIKRLEYISAIKRLFEKGSVKGLKT